MSVGDSAYIISLSGGQLYLGGRMVVKRIVTRPEAVQLLNNDDLYNADEWIVDPEKSGTLLNLHHRLSPALTKQLRLILSSGPSEPVFESETELYRQATRGVREITPVYAALLDRIIEATDRLPRTGELVTVTEEMLGHGISASNREEFGSPDDVPKAELAYSPQDGDQRQLAERQIRERRGQPQFRDSLCRRYGNRCVVTGCDITAVLEAAHINPYRGENDNHPANGLLLRADIHTLFDLDLLGIEPTKLRVELHPAVVGEYVRFIGVRLKCSDASRPSREALAIRYEEFCERTKQPA
jgi:hypothetical protein